ncbi:MAG: Ig domain-containing protein, partial [Bryobacteraceae bacterium]
MKSRIWFALLVFAALSGGPLFAQVPTLAITTPSLADGAVGVSYYQLLTATGGYGAGTYTWSWSSSILPPGLTLSPAGVISGVPTASGSFPVLIQVTSAAAGVPALPPASQSYTLTITFAPLSITTTSLPYGVVGSTYSASLTASGGYPPYTWSVVQGSLPLPGGLTLSSSGLISGMPTSAGTFNFLVEVQGGETGSAARPFTITVVTPVRIISTSPLPDGSVGTAYSVRLAATGGATPFAWSAPKGGLPPGLSLDGTAGVIRGTPTTTGNYSFAITVTDYAGTQDSYTFMLWIGSSLSITTSSFPNGMVGENYSTILAATGGTPPYEWSVTGGSLPDGLSLSSGGILSGSPAAAGASTFTVQVRDAQRLSTTRTLNLVIVPALQITTTSPLQSGVAGNAYSTQFAAVGGTSPYTWTVTSGTLAPGLTLDASSGLLEGTPTSTGTYSFAVTVADWGNHKVTANFTLTVAATLVITTGSPLPNGAVASPYSTRLATTGGVPPLKWSVSSGALPSGLTLDAASGTISGTPTTAGDFDFTITVSDDRQTARAQYRLTIALPPAPPLSVDVKPDSGLPATQPTLDVRLSQGYSQEITGQVALTFAPDSGADDPAVQFTTGGRTAGFRIAAGTTPAVFSTSSVGVQTGTVAGTITLTTRMFVGTVDVTPTPAPTKIIRIAKSAPVITSVSVAKTSSGFDLVVIGYSTPREVATAVVSLTAKPEKKLSASLFT